VVLCSVMFLTLMAVVITGTTLHGHVMGRLLEGDSDPLGLVVLVQFGGGGDLDLCKQGEELYPIRILFCSPSRTLGGLLCRFIISWCKQRFSFLA
jgi:hypothetical protein